MTVDKCSCPWWLQGTPCRFHPTPASELASVVCMMTRMRDTFLHCFCYYFLYLENQSINQSIKKGLVDQEKEIPTSIHEFKKYMEVGGIKQF